MERMEPMLQSLKPAPKPLQKGDFVEFINVAKPKPIDSNARWHILIAEPNRELSAHSGLVSRGFAPYTPVIHKQISAGRTRKRDEPRAMFTCYLFLPIPDGQDLYSHVLAVPGVAGFMKVPGSEDVDRGAQRAYAILGEEAIEAIRKRETHIEGLRQAKIAGRVSGNRFEVGQSVAVPLGRFDQLAGKITQVLGKNVEVLLEMEFMGRKSVTVAAGRVLDKSESA